MTSAKETLSMDTKISKAVVLDRLHALFQSSLDARQGALQKGMMELHLSRAGRWNGEPIPTRIDCVTDRVSGLDYAAWCLGEAVGAFGGITLMREVYDEFSAQFGGKASSWLDHRWDGVEPPGGGIWVA
jgi:hypothetical protein